MLLQNKNAVIYGAGGSLGSAVANALAKAGANVFVTGHRIETVQKTADKIKAAGGNATAHEIDAMDASAVQHHLDVIIKTARSIDISFNAVGVNVVQNIPLVDISENDFVDPITLMIRTRFLTAIAAGKIMLKQQSGVILSLTATPGGIGYPYTGGFAPACAAVESFSSNLAAELGIYGVRVVNIRSGGSPDSAVFKNAIDTNPEEMEPILHQMEQDTMLKKLPLMEDVANTAVFLCSDMAAKITGVTVDVTSGTTAGLNYRAKKHHP